MRDDEHEQRCEREMLWRIEIDLPEPMVHNFRQWWDTEGWWSFRAWHEQRFNSNSEWEKFMCRLWGDQPVKKRPLICDPLDSRSE